MPNLPAHLSLASRAASRVRHPIIDAHLGSFLLGSTSPDIRIMTKCDRDRTHFAPLSFENVGAGVKGLLEAHPALANPSRLSAGTRAFLSGYFTHLVADETWILEIYRPFFGDHGASTDRVRANIWDRALQLGLDSGAREDLGDIDHVRLMLDAAECGVDVGFIAPETLAQWREWVSNFATGEFTWDRLRFATNRMYRDDAEAMKIADEFLGNVGAGLEQVHGVVSQDRILDYRESVVRESSRLIKEYLGEPDRN